MEESAIATNVERKRKMDWLLSGLAIVSLWLVGNKNYWGFIVGLVTQVFWFYYAFTTEQFGLVPGVIIYTVVYARNLWKWKEEEKNEGKN